MPRRDLTSNAFAAVILSLCVAAEHSTSTARLGTRPILATPGVSDRNAHPEQVVGVELRVVDDVIPMSFGTGEEIAPEVIPDTDAGMKQEVGAVQVDAAPAGNQIAIAKFVVEEHRLAADAGHEIATDFVCEPGCVNRIQVIEKWAVRLEAVIYGALVAKSDFSIQPQFARRKILQGGARVYSTARGGGKEPYRCASILRRPDCAAPYREIHLLSTGHSGSRKQRAGEYH